MTPWLPCQRGSKKGGQDWAEKWYASSRVTKSEVSEIGSLPESTLRATTSAWVHGEYFLSPTKALDLAEKLSRQISAVGTSFVLLYPTRTEGGHIEHVFFTLVYWSIERGMRTILGFPCASFQLLCPTTFPTMW